MTTSIEPTLNWISDPIGSGFDSIIMDSRNARPGALFFALRGYHTDGHSYLRQVANGGCRAAVVETPDFSLDLPQLVVPDTAQALGDCAAVFYGTDDGKTPYIAVTGTTGKTTTATMTASVLQSLMGPVGLVTTAGIYHPSYVQTEMPNTTPDALTLHKTIHRLRELGSAAIVLETSSHGIQQRRIGGVPIQYAIFTNLSHEHLDYHHTMEEYASVKARLFKDLPEDGVAVVRITDPWAATMIAECQAEVIGYGIADDIARLDETEEGAALIKRCSKIISADDIKPTKGGGLQFLLHCGEKDQAALTTPLIGNFNVENLMAAAGVAIAMGHPIDEIASALSAFKGVVGRQERIELGQNFKVMVDFAHTPAALETLLKTIKPMIQGKLRLVLAVAGDRDRTKRPKMAALAGEYADALTLTLQKTLSEDPAQILQDMEDGLEGVKYTVEPVRPAAIRQVMQAAEPGDQVIIIGVMSATHIDMKGNWIPYQDHEVIKQAIAERMIRDLLAGVEKAPYRGEEN